MKLTNYQIQMRNKRPSFLETYGVVNVDGKTVRFTELSQKDAVELATQVTKELEELASFYNRVFGEASK
jgi:hypothetical protein